MISNCGSDERGRYSGGSAGDNTGGEWKVRTWYNRPWNCVLRHPDSKVRELLSNQAKSAAENDNVGYDQLERYTFWEQLVCSGYDASKITVKCEADCSSGVAAIVKAVGYQLEDVKLKNVSIYAWTGNLRSELVKAGFTVLNDNKYLNSDKYLLAGDILLNEASHTAINLNEGSLVNPDNIIISNKNEVISNNSSVSGSGAYMFNCPQISKGSEGKAVKLLQRLLKGYGYDVGKYGVNKDGVDGEFGTMVYKAVISFQKAKGLEADGIVGTKTWSKLIGM